MLGRGSPGRIRTVSVEIALLLGIAVAGVVLVRFAESTWIARTHELAGAVVPPRRELDALALRAGLEFAVGTLLLAVGRLVSGLRSENTIRVPLLLPATALACLLGLSVHAGSVDFVRRTIDGHRAIVVLAPTAVSFADGYALGALVAAILLVLPTDPAHLARRFVVPIALAIAALFVALAVFGSGPSGSGTRINLGPVQPIEVVKVLFVLFLASYLGARASKLRWQRQRILGLRWPRPVLLVPAVFVLLTIFGGLVVVGDLGPVMILAFVFLAIFYLVTRATGWAVVALGLVVAMSALVSARPELVGAGRVVTRVRMWQEPWTSGIAYGSQLGESLWAVAAGGPFGQGLGNAYAPLVAAGKTDLALATLAEQLGTAGILAYVASFAVVVFSGFAVAMRARTPERVLLAAGGSILLVAQWAIIHAGTFGVLPLTGVVVPFVSLGRSSMIAFLAVVGMLARTAESGELRMESPELTELHRSARDLALVSVGVVLTLLVAPVRVGVVEREATMARTIATRLGDGTLVDLANPRLLELARTLRRGSILDRNGATLASTEANGSRHHPLGTAMGTLLGAHPSRVLLPPWSLERVLEARLRGYGTRADPLTRRRVPDLREFVPLATMPRAERARRVAAMREDVASRSVRLAIDARLQRDVAQLVSETRAARSHLAVAAVVLEVDTGRVLARVQAPDLDPDDARWQSAMAAGDATFTRSFTGAYGAWPDKTGTAGHFQSGSVGKLYTALAAIRAGSPVANARAPSTYPCVLRDGDGPYFTRPGWARPIHDHRSDGLHGAVDLATGIAVSCNVFFGQLALELGPAPFRELHALGVDIGYGRAHPFEPGPAGSRELALTGFGQGAMVMNVVEAARLVGAIGGGGVYRRCPPTMELGAACEAIPVVADADALALVLRGMRRVMTSGTGHRLVPPEGVRVYGKTGTADVRGFRGEEPWGIEPGADAEPHSWFVALAEPADVPESNPTTRGRIAVAVVVPRGGSGASSAGPIAMRIVGAARTLGYLGDVASARATP